MRNVLLLLLVLGTLGRGIYFSANRTPLRIYAVPPPLPDFPREPDKTYCGYAAICLVQQDPPKGVFPQDVALAREPQDISNRIIATGKQWEISCISMQSDGKGGGIITGNANCKPR